VRRALAGWLPRRNLNKYSSFKAARCMNATSAERLHCGTLFLGTERDPGSMVLRVLCPLVVLALLASPAFAADHSSDDKLDPHLLKRANAPDGTSRVIVRTVDGRPATSLIRGVNGLPGLFLPLLGGQIAQIPDASLRELASIPNVAAISLDRPVHSTLERTSVTIGARWVAENLLLDGKGIGIATIDSGVTAQHDDLPTGRIVHFADFVGFQDAAYDDYGHGTHVAGILSGSGYDSGGRRRGIAPGANLVVLKALDGAGGGSISNVIAAIEYAIARRETFNIRVINLSVAAGVYESYTKDPLALAAKRAVDAGIVVVAAAGNLGRGALGRSQYGGIASPGNAPWVLTVGASSHMRTIEREDDQMAAFSSRGPSAIDKTAKPDLVAPGVGIESLAEPASVLFAAHPNARLWGSVNTISQPYLGLSGTSMAAPAVAGTIALMLQANPSLTPNAVKAILQFTAEDRDGYDHLTQGAGFLNARGAVELAKRFAGQTEAPNDPTPWSRHIIWANRLTSGGMLTPAANAWSRDVVWGSTATAAGDAIAWGTLCAPDEPACSDGAWKVGCDLFPAGCSSSDDEVQEAGDVLEAPCDEADCAGDIWATAEGSVLAGSVTGWRNADSHSETVPAARKDACPELVECRLVEGWLHQRTSTTPIRKASTASTQGAQR
jgi:serine protease AprX